MSIGVEYEMLSQWGIVKVYYESLILTISNNAPYTLKTSSLDFENEYVHWFRYESQKSLSWLSIPLSFL